MVTVTIRENGRKRVKFFTEGKSRTEQSHRKRVNINTIVSKYRKTGLFPQRQDQPTYGDFSGIEDFHACQNRIIAARDDFMSIPSEIRKRFGNDVGNLLDFINDPENLQEAIELGLVAEPPEPEKVATTEPPEPEDTPEAIN